MAIGRGHSGFLENRKGGLYRIAWKSCHGACGLPPRLLSPNTCVPLGEGARMTNTAGIPGDRICSFIERVEHIDDEIKALNEGKKEVFAEAKGEGFDVKVLREILRPAQAGQGRARRIGVPARSVSQGHGERRLVASESGIGPSRRRPSGG